MANTRGAHIIPDSKVGHRGIGERLELLADGSRTVEADLLKKQVPGGFLTTVCHLEGDQPFKR
jgi:hypothetical protein